MKFLIYLTIPLLFLSAFAGSPSGEVLPGDEMIARYCEERTRQLAGQPLVDITSLDEWNEARPQLRQELFDMLGLHPLPDRTPLNPTITRTIQADGFTVENLHFQSSPGLYVTANLYLPSDRKEPAPAILYLCGHARRAENGVSYGNKTAYQHHAAWFARHGYVCLILDTLQLGEIEGIHHGTHREGMWWWNSRGYTPAGVEAWNCIRALDYLETRSEVDPKRIGATGRSGGGIYSWWIAALDDRIQAAAPVAGITDLENHVIDGVVEGHCDCMFLVNTFHWDYPTVAALVAPRPLLIANSDKDSIFPLEGVARVHSHVRRIYNLHAAGDKLGLLITEGPHKDTQDLQLPVFRWFNRHLSKADPLIETAAVQMFAPPELQVFSSLPADQRNQTIHESFVPLASTAPIPDSQTEWTEQCRRWKDSLLEKSFRSWPREPDPLRIEHITSAQGSEDARVERYEFTSHGAIRLPLFIARTDSQPAKHVTLHILDSQQWEQTAPLLTNALHSPPESPAGHLQIYLPPRGIGPTAWNSNPRKQTQIRRRLMLLGETLDSGRVWDIRRAIQAIRALAPSGELTLAAQNGMAVNTLYAALYEPEIATLRLQRLPTSHHHGPDYLNVLRILDIPEALALVAGKTRVHLAASDPAAIEYAKRVAAQLNWPEDQLTAE